MDGGGRAIEALLPPVARAGRAAPGSVTFHGYVARLRSCHRRRSYSHPCGDGTLRAKKENVKVGYFSPLPPARTGVADYAATLLAALKRLGNVEPGARNADVNLYQIGNNQLHRDIYAKALAEPGVVVLHDAGLQHFFLGSLNQAQYVDELIY